MLIKKVTPLVLITLICVFTFSACFDLGAYENDEEYIASFDNFTLKKTDGSTVTKYSMGDFYNKEAINGFSKPMSREECSEFVYFYFEVKKSITMGEFAMYFNSTTKGDLKVSLFILKNNELPTKLYDPKSEDNDSNEPSDDKIIASKIVSLNGQEKGWNSMVYRGYLLDGKSVKHYPVSSGDYIVLRFDNNHYSFALREIDKMKKEVNQANSDYLSKKAIYEEKKSKYDNGDVDVSKNDVEVSKNEMDTSFALFELKNNNLKNATTLYEEEKAKYPNMDIRMTALLIRAEEEKK